MECQECIFCGTESVSQSLIFHATAVSTCPLLEGNLSSMFILRKILKVPESTCVRFLKTYGNPDHWFSCCRNCSALVNKATAIFNEIVELKTRCSVIRENLRNKVRETTASHSSSEYEVLRELRSFITLPGLFRI